MHHRARISLCSLLLPLLMACGRDPDDTVPPPATDPAEAPAAAPAPPGQATLPPELASRVDAYTNAWNGNDPAAVSEFFTEDATATVGEDTYTGRQEIRSGWLENVTNINNLQINQMRTEQRGQDYYSEGTYTHAPVPTGPGAGGTGGRFTVTWTRAADGQWRIRSTEVMPDAPPQT